MGAGSTSKPAADADIVEIEAPDIAAYRAGNTGIPYVTTFDSGQPGPHAAICALMHGNEICGAIALSHLLEGDVRPTRGTLSLIFANTDAYETFDPGNPNASRFLDEDMNRLWIPAAAFEHAQTNIERARVHVLRPFIDNVDTLLDLHSMQSDTSPLYLAGPSEGGRRFARNLGGSATIVCDPGHGNGTRLRDYGPFNDDGSSKTALLAECGQHWRQKTAGFAIDTAYRFLLHLDMIAGEDAAKHLLPAAPPDHWVEVTDRFVPQSDHAHFIQPFEGMEVIAEAGTVIARDGHDTIRTPYDECVLIMPARHLVRHQTGVRLGRRLRFEGPDAI